MLLLCLLILNINAQVFTTVTEDGGPGMGIDDFEVEPIFPGNDPDLLYFFQTRVFPYMPAREALASSTNQEQLIVLSFRMDTLGHISNRNIEYSTFLLMDNAFLQAFFNMPDWKPGIIDGKKIEMQVYLPIAYTYINNELNLRLEDDWLREESEEGRWLRYTLAGMIVVAIAAWGYMLLQKL